MNNEQRILLVEELYHQYYPRLYQYCRRYVGYNHAFDPLIEDCIQEVFLELDKEIEILQQHPALEGWIMTTCKHRLMTSLDKLRRRNKFVAFSMDDSYAEIPDPSPSVIDLWAEQEDARESIAHILSILNTREQQIVKDYFFNHIPIQTIAEQEGTTVSAVKSVIARIRQKLRNILPIVILLMLLKIMRWY